tara:strand:+ start:8274 stop:8726 length:453 start_codon:yes stop_codon:yes gene_type:complete
VEKNYLRRLNLIVTDEKILRQMSKEVSKVDTKVLKDMEDTMKKFDGIGISAIQIGAPQRIFLAGNPAQVFINPKIKDKSSYTKVDWEGCLSCPGAHVRVRRSHSITIQYEDIEGKIIKRKFTGFDARVIQHELDHLNGFLIKDRGKVYQE